MALCLPARVVAAPRPDYLLDLVLHALAKHRQASSRAEREQPLLSDLGDLGQPRLHLVRQRHPRLGGRGDLDGV